jgi:hypothetical protein
MKDKLIKLIESTHGPIEWGGSMGWGDGIITCSVKKDGMIIKGVSGGDCTSLEALIDLASKLNIKLGI